MCAKHYENPTMLSRVTAKNVGDVFLRHTVYYRLFYHVYDDVNDDDDDDDDCMIRTNNNKVAVIT